MLLTDNIHSSQVLAAHGAAHDACVVSGCAVWWLMGQELRTEANNGADVCRHAAEHQDLARQRSHEDQRAKRLYSITSM